MGSIVSLETVKYALANPASHDFGAAFYTSARAGIDGGRPDGPQELPNFNPPTVTRVLLVPFARLELRHALVLWNVAGAALPRVLVVGFSGPIAWVHLPAESGHSASCSAPLGQQAWCGSKDRSRGSCSRPPHSAGSRIGAAILAGICLGVIVAAKPFFAAAALPLGITTCIAAAATSIPLSLISVMVSGWPVWADWLRTAGQVDMARSARECIALGICRSRSRRDD